ncbi:cell division protein FtsB [Bradyrhizobium sp. URHC0002]
MQRRRSPAHTFEENIAAEKARLEAQIAKLKPGPQRDALLKKISQLETASDINEWLTSPGLRPPELV